MTSQDEQTLARIDVGGRPRTSHGQPVSGVHTRAGIDHSTWCEQEAAGPMKSAADVIFAHSPEILQRSAAQQAAAAVDSSARMRHRCVDDALILMCSLLSWGNRGDCACWDVSQMAHSQSSAVATVAKSGQRCLLRT
ncbi:hypothetical protein [Burkholderia anthina]|uniref:hypothetical protein n=1 Tax=Burkholderia anthina TaxID=179879 RepID=UPI00158CD6FC|nr:hypothetical protein [Burkholderia anthina]